MLSRVLFEISSTVCIQVSSSELSDFGVVYDKSDDHKEDDSGSKRSRKPKKPIRFKAMVLADDLRGSAESKRAVVVQLIEEKEEELSLPE